MVRFLHIAGSKGKGGTAWLLAHALELLGEKVGLFMSPFLLEEREMIRIQREPISQDFFQTLQKKIMEEEPSLSSFEQLTQMAYRAFKEEKCTFWVVECGWGGQRDATEWFAPEKTLTFLTHIEFEHTEILGKTLKEITEEKLGIARPGIPLLTPSTQVSEVINILQTHPELDLYFVEPHTLGNHHPESVGLLYEALRLLDYELSAIDLDTLQKSYPPGHFEKYLLTKNHLLILDGAHTRDSLQFVQEKVRKMKLEKDFEKLIWGIHTLKDKPPDLYTLFPEKDLTWISLEDDRASSPPLDLPSQTPEEFLSHFLKISEPSIAVVTGSFRLVAAFKKLLQSQHGIF